MNRLSKAACALGTMAVTMLGSAGALALESQSVAPESSVANVADVQPVTETVAWGVNSHLVEAGPATDGEAATQRSGSPALGSALPLWSHPVFGTAAGALFAAYASVLLVDRVRDARRGVGAHDLPTDARVFQPGGLFGSR